MLYNNKFLFSEEPVAGATPEAGASTETNANADVAKLQEQLTAIKNNSEKILKEKKELEGKLKAIDDGDKLKKGEYEKLLADKNTELETVNAELATAKAEAEEAKVFKAEQRKELIDQLPTDELKEIAEDIQDLTKLRKFVKTTSVKDPAKVDTGNATGAKIELTAKQKQEAKDMFPAYDSKKAEEQYLMILEKQKKKE